MAATHISYLLLSADSDADMQAKEMGKHNIVAVKTISHYSELSHKL